MIRIAAGFRFLSLACVTLLASCSSTHALFDGKSLDGWKKADFAGAAEPSVEDNCIFLPAGVGLTGIVWAKELPFGPNFEISCEARRIEGSDIFCGITFPVAGSYASLIIGGWGGGVCGISSLDGHDASENETSTFRQFESGRWYKIRLRVADGNIQAWIDDESILKASTQGRKVGVRADIKLAQPLGLCSWRTKAALRKVEWREAKD